MKMFTAFFCALFVAVSAPAQGVYNMAKQQAKNAVASENRNQQAINSAGSPAPTPPQNNPTPAPSANPTLQATLQNIASLRADFETLVSGPTNATNAASSQPLINDLTAAAQSAKPSPASVAKLARDLTTILAGNDKLRTQQQKLATWVHAVFNSSHLSPAQSQMIHDGVQKIFADAGVPVPDAANVINDIQTIATQTQ
jgi:hypothetical protein